MTTTESKDVRSEQKRAGGGVFLRRLRPGLLGIAAVFFGAASLLAGPIQLVSTRNPLAPLPAAGDGDSVDPAITPDGRFVLFTSAANDLTTNGNGLFVLNLFLRDRASHTTALVSANGNGTGGDDNSIAGMVSTNGRYAVFQSDADDLVPGDTNGATDVFLRDMAARTTALVSVATDGGFGNGDSTEPSMTPDGRFVVFISAATNLVANDANGAPDVFVRDLATGTTTLVSVGAAGTNSVMADPVVTPDGSHVAFFSTARNLASGVPAASKGEIYVRNLTNGTTLWASTNAEGILSNLFHFYSPNLMPSYHPALSDDGNIVAFKAGWTNGTVAPLQGIGGAVILRFDAATRTTTLVSSNAFPAWAYSDDVYGPEMTPDGRFIAFVATNGPPLNSLNVQVWDSQTGSNIFVSAAPDGSLPTNTVSSTPVISPDGRFVAFLSSATNLVTNTVSSGMHVYVRDLQAGTTQLVDADTNGAGSADDWGTIPSLSDDGQFVAFCAPDQNFVSGNNSDDVFLRDTAGAATELISQRDPLAVPRSGNATSLLGPFSVSADGRRVAFSSYASDLVTNDFNDNPDVFVTDLQSGSASLVSVGLDGNAADGPSYSPVISANGQFVAFASAATNLAANQTNNAENIFVRDLETGITTLASVNSTGASLGTGDDSAPVISSDGRYVAFLCETSPAVAYPSTFWRDLETGVTIRLCNASALGPSISADGQRVACFDSASRLYVWDAGLAKTLYTNLSSVAFAALAPTGNRILWTTPSPVALNVTDLASGANLLSIAAQAVSPTPLQGAAPWSADGRFLTFVTPASLVPDDTNGTNDVYLCDLQTGMLTLISANSGGTAGANDVSDMPSISADGRFIAYRSFATDIVPGVAIVPSLYVFDRTTGANAVLATGTPDNWSSWMSRPVPSGNGTAVVFESVDSGLVAGDLNRAPDVFAASQGALVADSDNDGIPDWWMLKYFGHPTGEAADLSLAQDDADGNGMSNLQKYLAGIDPTNPKAVFALQISPAPLSGGVSLTWPAVAGKSYLIQYADDLSNPAWQNFRGSIAVVGGQGSITIPAGPAFRYYRVACVN